MAYPYPNSPAPARPWWRHPAVLVLALLLFPPVALALIWRSPWARPNRIAALVMAGLWTLIWLIMVLVDPAKPQPGGAPSPVPVASSASPSPSPSPSLSPTPAPSPTPTPTPTVAPTTEQPAAVPPTTEPVAVYYANCDAVRAAGKAPLSKGSPGYRAGLDADGDGIACETERAPATTAPAPAPTQPAPAKSTSSGGGATYYQNCDAVRAAGMAPLYRGQPGYRSALDRDNDGVACE